MKFMKLGSKPDQFQTGEGNIRYVATELAADLIITVGDVKFYLHKFPLLSKCSKLQKLISAAAAAAKEEDQEENDDEIEIHDIPGGPASFEICAKFCYGMIAVLNPYNLVAARSAAEYLEMYETVEKGNIIRKIDVFLSSSILRGWKDSIITLQTTMSFLPWSEELKLIDLCVDSISSKASMDPSKVDWSYTYNSKSGTLLTGKQNDVPKDWWVEDLCELSIDLFKKVIEAIKGKGRAEDCDVIGKSLAAYTLRRLDYFNPLESDYAKYRYLVDTIVCLLPKEKGCVPCNFLLKLLQSSIVLGCGEKVKAELIRRIGQQLNEANASDFSSNSMSDEATTLLDIDTVHSLVEQFVIQERDSNGMRFSIDSSSKAKKVARLVDGYLAEAARRDSSLPFDKFFDLSQMVSTFPRQNHDAIYRAIDMYLKEHSGLSKGDKKKICRLMDRRKLSSEACAHAVQNERLPLRLIVQILFFEQARMGKNGGGNNNNGVLNLEALVPNIQSSHGSSTSSAAATSSEEDWDGGDRKCKEISDSKCKAENFNGKKGKKLLSRIWSGKEREGENGSSSSSSDAASESGGLEVKKKAVQVMMHRQMLKRLYGQGEEKDVKSLGR